MEEPVDLEREHTWSEELRAWKEKCLQDARPCADVELLAGNGRLLLSAIGQTRLATTATQPPLPYSLRRGFDALNTQACHTDTDASGETS